MLSKYMCIPFYYNQGYGLGDVTSDEDDTAIHNDARLELNSIIPLKKYYPTQKLTSEPSKLSTSAISSTDIFKSPVHRAESAPSNENSQSAPSGSLLAASFPQNSSSATSLSARNSSLLSTTLLKKLSFNLDTSNETHDKDCQENNNNLEKKTSIPNYCHKEEESDKLQNSSEKLLKQAVPSPNTTENSPSCSSSPGLSNQEESDDRKSPLVAQIPTILTQQHKPSLKEKVSTKSKRLKKMIRKASRSQSPSISKSYEEDRRQYFLNTYTGPVKEQAAKADNLYQGQNFLSPRKQSHLALSLDTYKRIISQKLSKEKAIDQDDSSNGINSANSSPKSTPKILRTAPSLRESFSASNTPLIVRRLTKQASIFDNSYLSVNPSGRVCLRLYWDKNTHVLTVTIIQSNKILFSEKPKSVSKIQFHVTLLNQEKAPKYKTSTKEYSEILNFDENFYFPNIEKYDLAELSIAIILCVKESFGTSKPLSQALYNLGNLTLNDQYNYVTLYFEEFKKKSDSSQNLEEISSVNSVPSLNSLTNRTEKPELLIGLKYDALLGNLLVKILKGSNLIDRTIPDKSPNTFVRVVLTVDNVETKYQTSLKKSTLNPVYEEMFEFNLAAYQVENARLIIYVYSKRLLTSKNLIGCIIYDDQPGHDEYVSHLKSAIASDGEMVQKWHSLIF
ncbi:synaptotagmin-16 isoform X4 [Brachionus plicatilis]|uniref:Synaptotagmin-16 isoform X4 n=1 Tax=Brachionus plicatilis TaxID=10195 RepID=A0A3M7T6F6_BRAPC|nr:synaptotagmin-16 isoform X4 [Brachionus plicatilis]